MGVGMFSLSLRAIALVVSLVFVSGVVRAAPITQTINFSFDDFAPFASSTSPTLITEVTGAVSFTYDNATPTSLFDQAVDSISFSTPSGFFLTSDVRFELRVGPDRLFASNSYELDFYHNMLGVESNLVGDFLFRVGAIGPVGADVPGGGAMGGQFLLIDRPGTEGFAHVSQGQAALLTSTSVPAATEIPEPAPLMILGFGLAALGLARRRR